MSERLMLRRHLYEQLRRTRLGVRHRRSLRRQIAIISRAEEGPDDGTSGVREPRRPSPSTKPGGSARRRTSCRQTEVE